MGYGSCSRESKSRTLPEVRTDRQADEPRRSSSTGLTYLSYILTSKDRPVILAPVWFISLAARRAGWNAGCRIIFGTCQTHGTWFPSPAVPAGDHLDHMTGRRHCFLSIVSTPSAAACRPRGSHRVIWFIIYCGRQKIHTLRRWPAKVC